MDRAAHFTGTRGTVDPCGKAPMSSLVPRLFRLFSAGKCDNGDVDRR